MRIFYTLILSFFCFSVFSQNWNLINEDYKCYYGTSADNNVPVYVVNSYSNHPDTINYFLNTSIGYCDTCINLDPQEYFLKNVPTFLRRKVLKQGGNYLFYEPDSLLIKTKEPINSLWLFDAQNNVSAQIISVTESNLFGIQDSIKTILLSTNDTIKFSKNYGILKFQYGNIDKNLIGIKTSSTELGVQARGFKEYYGYEVGDVFQYIETDHNGSVNQFTNIRTIKVEILSKTETINELSYNVIERISSSGYLEPLYQENTKMLTYVYDANSLAEKKDFDVINTSLSCGFFELRLVNGHLDSKEFGYDALIDYDFDFYKLETVNHPFDYLKITEGLGLVKKIMECGEVSYSKELVGYIKNGVQTGEIWEDWQFTRIKDLNKEANISVFPNPSSESISINFETPEEKIKVSVLNNLGETVFSKRYSNLKAIEIDVDDFAKGIYFLKLESERGIYQQKIKVD